MKLFADVFQQSLGKLRKKEEEEDGSKRLFRANRRTSPKVDVGEGGGGEGTLFFSSFFFFFFFFLSVPFPFFFEDLLVVLVLVLVVWRTSPVADTNGTDRRKVRGKKEGKGEKGKTRIRGGKRRGWIRSDSFYSIRLKSEEVGGERFVRIELER